MGLEQFLISNGFHERLGASSENVPPSTLRKAHNLLWFHSMLNSQKGQAFHPKLAFCILLSALCQSRELCVWQRRYINACLHLEPRHEDSPPTRGRFKAVSLLPKFKLSCFLNIRPF